MADKALANYPAHSDGVQRYTVDHTGPASYVASGDVIGQNNFNGTAVLGLSAIDQIYGSGSYSVSGNYQVFAQPSGTGSRRIWNLIWSTVAGTVASVAGTGGSGMTPGTYALAFSGGGGSGAAGTITVLTATTFSTPVITNGGRGYTSAPTVTAATAGTPPTLTATLNTGAAATVGTNLSAETVRLTYEGR